MVMGTVRFRIEGHSMVGLLMVGLRFKVEAAKLGQWALELSVDPQL